MKNKGKPLSTQKKRGYFYSIDALIALLIIISVLIFFRPVPKENIELKNVQEDVLKVLSNVKVGDVDNSYVKSLIADGSIDNTNRTLLEQIGEFHVLGKYENASKLTQELFNELQITDNIGVWMNKNLVYTKNSTPIETSSFVWTAQELVSGVKENIGNATTGFSARPLILRNSLTEYFYFGGYVGDANESIIANLSYNGDIKEARIEAQISNNFSLYINGNFIGNYLAEISSLTVIDLSPYLSYFASGNNIIEFKVSPGDKLFISGGYIAVNYETSELFKLKKEYRFPGISGVINLYDSFYIPSSLNEMEVFLHYKTDYNTTLTIANESFKIPITQTTYTIDNTTLSSKLNYVSISTENIPLRLRLDDLDFVSQVSTSNVDVVLVLDSSASMRSNITDSSSSGDGQLNGKIINDCNNPALFNGNTSRMSIAKCVAKNFTEKILSAPGNNISIVIFNDKSNNLMKLNLTNNKTQLFNMIDSAITSSGTCTCCGLNNAYDEFTNNSASGRKRVAILFTDGAANHLCQPAVRPPLELSECGGNTGIKCAKTPRCWHGTLTQGINCGLDCSANEMDNEQNWAAIQNAIWSAEVRLNQSQNVTVYSVGINPSGCDSLNYLIDNVAERGGGKNFTASDGYAIAEAFNIIAEEIIKLGFVDQTSFVTGFLNKTILYPDSYIRFDYPDLSQPKGTALSYRVNFAGSGEGVFNLINGFNISEASVLSYSGAKWTKALFIENSLFNTIFFNLTKYNTNYLKIGDPFVVHIPSQLIASGINKVNVFVGADDNEFFSGSTNNKFALTIIKPLAEYTSIYAKIVGCNWSVQTVDGNIIFKTPSNYAGTKLCVYNPASSDYGDYDINDAYDHAILSLLQELDTNGDKILDIPISTDNIEIEGIAKAGIPFTWSSVIEIRVWR